MYRKLASVILVAGAISAKYAGAVSLGEITMLSALNEPLQAEIRLSNTGDLDNSQILINFAEPEDFVEAGLERTFFHSDIQFTLKLDGKGNGVVVLASRKRLNEPFLDLLIEAKWPTGRMLRSYTALVDLPVYDEPDNSPVTTGQKPAAATGGRAAPVAETAAVVSVAATPAAAAPAAVQEEAASAAPAAQKKMAPRKALQEGEYWTQRDDTLWRIASRHVQGQDVSVEQAMLAIQQANPQAFMNNNINRLKAGVVLRLPSLQAIQDVSARAAQQRVSEQNRQWRDAQLDTRTSPQTQSGLPGEAADGHLRLTSAGAAQVAGAGDDKAAAELQQQLINAREQLDVATREKQELNTRVDSLGSQVEQLKRLVELKDAELASLQNELGQKAKKPADTGAVAKPEKTTEATPAVSEKPAAPAAKPASDEPAVAKPAPAAKKAPAEPARPAPAKPAEPTLVEKIIANPIYIGVPAILIVAGMVGFLLRRRSKAERQLMEENDSFSFDDNESDFSADETLYAGAATSYEEAEQEHDVDQAMDNESYREQAAADDVEEEAPATMAQTGDAISEAEIYIAYNRFDQAAELLRNAIAGSPDDVALRSKLLEVCVAAGDKDGFQNAFLDLQARGENEAVDQAKELLSTADAADWLDDLPETEGFAGETADTDEFALDSSLDETLDFGLAEAGETELDLTLDDDLGSDLDLSAGGLDDFADDFASSLATDESSEDDAGEFALDELDLGDFAVSGEESADLELSGDELADSFVDEVEPAGSVEDDILSLDDTEHELSLDNDDELSLDLSSLDETQLDVAPAATDESAADDVLDFDFSAASAGEAEEDVLELDGIGLEAGEAESAPSFDEELSESGIDELSLDELDFSGAGEMPAAVDEESITPALASEDEEQETLSLADFDLDFDDIEPESGEQTMVRDAISEQELSPGEVTEAVSEPAAPAASALQPHQSQALDVLESDNLAFLSDADEVATKLDLAQAYIDMGDVDGARDILLEVVKEGSDEQKSEATALLDTLD